MSTLSIDVEAGFLMEHRHGGIISNRSFVAFFYVDHFSGICISPLIYLFEHCLREKTIGRVFVEALFYGLYLATLFISLRWLLLVDEGWKLRYKINWIILLITMAIFGFITTNSAIFLWGTMVAAATAVTTGSVSSPTWINVVTCVDTNMTCLLADAVLIHRLWIVYSRSHWIILSPVLLWIGAFICTVLQVYWQTVQDLHLLTVWQPVESNIGGGTILTPFWGSTTLINLYATPMIVYRLWRSTKSSEDWRASSTSLRFLMRVLIESGFVYLAINTAHFVVWFTPNTYAISIIAAMNPCITAIAFNLIIIRTSQKMAEKRLGCMHPLSLSPPITSIQFAVESQKIEQSGVLDLGTRSKDDSPVSTVVHTSV